VIDRFGVEGAFLLRVVLGLLAAGALLLLFPKRPTATRSIAQIDVTRGLLYAPGLCGILVVLNKVSQWGPFDLKTLGLLFASGAVLTYWWHHQRRQANPLINVRLLLGSRSLPTMIAMLLMGAGTLQVGALLSLILQQPRWTGVGFGIGAFTAGLIMLPGNLAPAISSPAAGALTTRLGARTTAILTAGLSTGVWAALAVTHASFWWVVCCGFSQTALLGMLYPGLVTLILQEAPKEAASEATGLGFVFLQAGSALGSQAIFALLALSSSHAANTGAAFPSYSGFTLAYSSCAGATLLLLLTLLHKPSRAGQSHSP
jgi:hypothetical protein